MFGGLSYATVSYGVSVITRYTAAQRRVPKQKPGSITRQIQVLHNIGLATACSGKSIEIGSSPSRCSASLSLSETDRHTLPVRCIHFCVLGLSLRRAGIGRHVSGMRMATPTEGKA